ncbi:MAG: excinuclease ABC subunit UvrC [Chloroflexi bacterium]|nr:excinuclease ABC subunit UvrC [Chloroflexota bacterium]
MNLAPQVTARLAGLPLKPGVYIMRDIENRVIYVGKAIVLRHRVRSYFQEGAQHPPKTQRLVEEVADLEWIVTGSELEALVLECELIKRYRPRYNVRLKDDKRYPYIMVTMQEDYPRIMTVRSMKRDGARYYGPFTSSQAVYQSLELIRRLFPYRTCNREITGHDRSPCLYYHIKLCNGPCIGAVSREGYRQELERACLFLEGKQEQIIERLHTEMLEASDALLFERAAQLRDTIEAITRVVEHQRIVSGHLEDHDFIAFAREDGQACVQVFFIRNGKLIGREYFILTGTQDETNESIMGSFLTQFYDEAAAIPPEVLLQNDLDELGVIQEWLQRKRGKKVLLKVPKRGDKLQVMQMARENATETLAKLRAEWDADVSKQTEAIDQLQKALGLPKAPVRIECYDISNIQGTYATGSMVVFNKGVASKQDYRHFRIRTVEGANDFASMAEVLRRRFARAHEQEQKSPDGKVNRWGLMPDLVIVDGGKGQLDAALGVIQELDLMQIPVAGLAKQNEELFLPGRPDSIRLPRDSQALYLVQRIRDEAHRFAVSYHRQLREKGSLASILEEIEGIGPQRRKALIKRFGSLEGIRQATLEELIQVPGMNQSVAEKLQNGL